MALSQSRPSIDAAPYATGGADRSATARAFAYCAVGAMGVLALFLLARPYGGILHDARLYIGYALATLHPGDLGQDMVLAEDGQSGFTVFPSLLVFVVGTFGSALGAKLVSLAVLVLWFGAAAALVSTLAQGRTRWVMLIFVAVLPAQYAGYGVFSYAEPLAVPRPFAEAFVLLALAFLSTGRKFAALVLLTIAALFHPIMALPGFAVWSWLMFFDARTRVVRPIVGIVAGLFAVTVLAIAAWFGVAVADRLFTAVDTEWRGILVARSPYLFVSAWTLADWSRLIVQAVTVALAASLVTGRARSLFIAVTAIGLGGVLVSLLFGDVLGSVLVLQVQPWRATWLLAVFAAAGLGLCSVGLWTRGAMERAALGILVLAWIEANVPLLAMAAAGLAFVLAFVPLRPETEMRRVPMVIWGIVAFCASVYLGTHLYALALLFSALPESGGALDLVRSLNLLAIPACVLAVWWASARPDDMRAFAVAAGLSVAVVFAAIAVWDDRAEWHVTTDRFGPNPELAGLVATRDGEVLWIGGGFATWSQAARPNWVSRLQGASNVFSRELALAWDKRTRFLGALGIVDARVRTPFDVKGRTSNEEPRLGDLSDARLERLCGLSDAPAWLVVPAQAMEDAAVSRDRWKPLRWTAPSPLHAFHWDGETITWTATQDYAVVPCAS